MATAYVVDDEPGIRRLFTAALRAAGLTVDAFAGLADLVRRHPPAPELAIVDYAMPGAAGDVVIRRCREDLGWRGTRFCLVTGSVELLPPSTGADLVLQKPVDLAELVSLCLGLLARPDRPGATTPRASPPPARAVAR
ncbi:MAG: response regulator [Clostridia bacterium]|nr:response regulator [Clostridia bacterium]